MTTSVRNDNGISSVLSDMTKQPFYKTLVVLLFVITPFYGSFVSANRILTSQSVLLTAVNLFQLLFQWDPHHVFSLL